MAREACLTEPNFLAELEGEKSSYETCVDLSSRGQLDGHQLNGLKENILRELSFVGGRT